MGWRNKEQVPPEIVLPEGCTGAAGIISVSNTGREWWLDVEADFACAGFKNAVTQVVWHGQELKSRADSEFFRQVAKVAAVRIISCHQNCIFNEANSAPQDIGGMIPRPEPGAPQE